MSSGEAYERAIIKKRLPANVDTVNRLLDRNTEIFLESREMADIDKIKQKVKQIHRNRRKIATLLEELSLRTQRLQPCMKRLEQI